MINLNIVILAGGLGKRMQSDLPKVLHCIQGTPMIVKLLTQTAQLKPSKILIIVGKYKDIIEKTINESCQSALRIKYVIQQKPLGTGDAVKCALPFLDDAANVIILNGDNPMLSAELLQNTIDNFNTSSLPMQISAIQLENPFGYGRIIVENGIFQQIVEEKDCNDQQRQIKLINCGIYLAKGSLLQQFIPEINNQNSQKEYYLTDIVKVCKNHDIDIGLYTIDQSCAIKVAGVNTKEQLDYLNDMLS